MKFIGVVRFLGTNCDLDVFQALELMKLRPKWIWYEDHFSVDEFSGVVLPGGFSYGDYLRCGALAARSPVMTDIRALAKRGSPILGICNGFQVLCESGLLPGALVRNEQLRFVDRWCTVMPKSKKASIRVTRSLRLPVAHGEGRYFIESDGLLRLKDSDQIWLTYQDNPNGSLSDIAGVCDESGRICGLMPHPERAMMDWMGGEDGREILKGFL